MKKTKKIEFIVKNKDQKSYLTLSMLREIVYKLEANNIEDDTPIELEQFKESLNNIYNSVIGRKISSNRTMNKHEYEEFKKDHLITLKENFTKRINYFKNVIDDKEKSIKKFENNYIKNGIFDLSELNHEIQESYNRRKSKLEPYREIVNFLISFLEKTPFTLQNYEIIKQSYDVFSKNKPQSHLDYSRLINQFNFLEGLK